MYSEFHNAIQAAKQIGNESLAKAIQERRVKTAYINPEFAIDILNIRFFNGQLAVPCIRDLIPEGSVAISIHADWPRRMFGVVIAHESFDPVSDGGIPPAIPQCFDEYQIVRIRAEGKQLWEGGEVLCKEVPNQPETKLNRYVEVKTCTPGTHIAFPVETECTCESLIGLRNCPACLAKQTSDTTPRGD